MTTIVTEELIEAVLENGAVQLKENGIVELFEVNTSYGQICLRAEQEDDLILYQVSQYNAGIVEAICTTANTEVAALVFNHFGTKE